MPSSAILVRISAIRAGLGSEASLIEIAPDAANSKADSKLIGVVKHDELGATHGFQNRIDVSDQRVELSPACGGVGEVGARIFRIGDRKLTCDYIEPSRGVL